MDIVINIQKILFSDSVGSAISCEELSFMVGYPLK